MKPIFFCCLLLSSVALHAQLNGVLLTAKNGKAVYRQASGFADYPTHTPNTIDARFNLASISKVFTSTAILQLMEKGELKLDDTFQSYFPDFPYTDITIRHLLTHTSGLPDLELFEELIKAYPDTIVNAHTTYDQLIKQHKPLPGHAFRYSNNGYVLLSLLVEKISQQSFATYLQEHIFAPVHMQHTTLYGEQVSKHTYASFHTDTLSRVRELKRFKYTDYNNSQAIGASEIVTTVDDMLLFDQAFFGGKLISPAAVKLALTPVHTDNTMDTMQGEGTGAYGLGWEIFDQPGYGKGAGHGGFQFGLATFYYHNLDKNQTIIAFDNTAASSFGRVVTSALHELNDEPALTFDHKKSVARAYATTLLQKGPDEAAVQLTWLQHDSANYYLSEREMNKAGYEFLYDANRVDLSLEVFKLNCLLFPLSCNTYDSYGEALLKAGKKKDATLLFEYATSQPR